MSLNTIYLWEPEIFTGKVPSEDNSYQVAFELHQQYGHIPSHGQTLRAWLFSFADKICDPQNQSFFPAQTQQWIQSIKEEFSQNVCAIIQLEALAQDAQNDAVYRVFYEAVRETGVGFYEPNYNVWAIGELQSPENAVEQMLQPYLLEPLQLQKVTALNVQPISVWEDEHFQAPKTMPEAEQLIRQWFEQQTYTKDLQLDVFNIAHDFISNWGNLERPELALDAGYRCFLLTQKQAGVFYQLKMVLRKLTVTPMLSFAMDFTDYFIPQHLQDQLPERLIFRLRSMDIHQPSTSSKRSEVCFPLIGRWDSEADIQDFFKNLNEYINFIFFHLGQGRLETLQAWVYGDMPSDMIIDLDFRFELMMIALSQDVEQLELCYQKQKALFTQNKARAHDLGLLEESYKLCQKLLKIVEDEGTALQPYIKN
ncbi:hypothetical protein EXE30_12930 [Acinetobacter halotolerans]|uniref:Uncharacterized protein n=1 Tax=Acinetobacter halotolerans TaxID=1752076 RepID=A0A4V2DAQ6_9GAMM|nr:hypothetical protein [Acinetobacter halotolerans]RZF50470.1 hypothetical protein EXE30_12930 [Acinetobacter halotolerans]